MDGIHDMGGMHGFGRVPQEKDSVFSSDWQRRAFALTEALAWSTPYGSDEHRQAIERIAPADYLDRDYFEKWIMAVEILLREAGLVDQFELDSGKKGFDVSPEGHEAIGPDDLVAATRAGADLEFDSESKPARYRVNQSIRVSNNCPSGHTRVPRYVRSRIGKIVKDVGVFQFADAVAAGKGTCPQHCYTVEFEAVTLWGTGAEANECIYVDLWESHLEPV